jgi:predicted ribosome quality control (RQC) complex YloA/Tae2 family protein
MKTEIFNYDTKEYDICIGQNNEENWKLIDNSKETDIWFHVEGEPSCHVILKNAEKMRGIPKQVIKRCACLCKSNSKAKTMKKCNVIYAYVKDIQKTEIVGQVIANIVKNVSV